MQGGHPDRKQYNEVEREARSTTKRIAHFFNKTKAESDQ